MNRWLALLINMAAFYALWLAAMYGAGKTWWWTVPVLALLSMVGQLRFSPSPKREMYLILAGAAVGTSLDWLGATLGFFRFVSQSTTEFLMLFGALWVNFGTTLRPSFGWMWRRPLLASLLGAIGGSSSYWVGAQIGAIAFVGPEWRGLLWVAVQFGIALPVWMLIANHTIGERAETSRRQTSHGATR